MWQGVIRIGLAVWLVAMVGLAVWGGDAPANAQGGARQYLPLVRRERDAFQIELAKYVGLVSVLESTPSGNQLAYYTVRGDSSGRQLLATASTINNGVWSPDGLHFVYQTENGAQTWLVPLATRQPRLVFEGMPTSGYTYLPPPVWSPDSRSVAYFYGTQLVIYDLQADRLETFDNIEGAREQVEVVWAPNSEHLAWVSGTSNNYSYTDMWVWAGTGQAPRKVGRDLSTALNIPQWSPDSSRVAFNLKVIENDRFVSGVYVATAAGPATRLIGEDYSLRGWLENGSRLLLYRDGNLYTTPMDASANQLFVTGAPYGIASTLLTPSGDGVFYIRNENIETSYFQAATSTVGAPSAACDLATFQWRDNADEFACHRRLRRPNTRGYFQTTLGDFSTSPPALTRTILDYLTVPLLPASTNFLALTHAPLTGGYPSPTYAGSYLYQIEPERFARVDYPQSNQYRVLEWRYMP